MTYICQAAGWMPTNKATQLWSRYALSGLCPLRSDLLEKLRPLVGELHLPVGFILLVVVLILKDEYAIRKSNKKRLETRGRINVASG